MASFSSSPSPDFSLAVKAEGGPWLIVPLYETPPAPGTLALETSLCVSDRGKFAMALASARPLKSTAQVTAFINGEALEISALQSQPISQGTLLLYALSFGEGGDRPFKLTFGFASVGLTIRFADDTCIELTTMEIPCSCSDMPQRNTVANMLTELSGSDGQEALAWMLGRGQGGAQASALRDGGEAEDRSRSIRAFISLAERSLATLEKNLSLFRSRPLSRTLPFERKVPAEKVRKVGRAEVEWLALNPDSLVEINSGHGLTISGKNYIPNSVRTSLPRRSLDNMENRVTLGFVNHIVESLEDAAAVLAGELRRMREVRSALASLEEVDGLLPSLVVADVCLELEEPLVGRIQSLGKRAKRMLRLYRDALGELPGSRYRLPRRSKAFQEIPHYAAVWTAMAEWESFGEFPLSRETLLLSTYKMDKLYEYYALYGLLKWLQDAGFSPDQEPGEESLGSVSYTLIDRYYKNETQVVNRYILRRGAERVALYYQPVIYGDERAEGGIDLHRTTPASRFAPYRQDRYWTPDFLVLIDDGKKRRRYVLDAKFRTFSSLNAGYKDGKRTDDGLNEFQRCLAKYRYEIMSEEGDQVDGVWLLCGRASRAKATCALSSSWLTAVGRQFNDGIASLAPGANALDELYAYFGLTKRGASEPIDALPAKGAESVSKDTASLSAKPKAATAKKAEDTSKVQPAQSMPTKLPKAAASDAGAAEEAIPTKASDESSSVSVKPDKDDRQQRKTRTIDAAILEDILVVWRSLPEKQRKNCTLFSQRELGLSHQFVKTQKPTGRELRNYAEEPVEIDGVSCYIFADWKPMYRARLAKAANLARKRMAK